MSMRRTTTTRRAMAAVSMTAALAFALAGCGDDGGEKPGNEGSSAPPAPASPSAEDKGASRSRRTRLRARTWTRM